MLDSLAPMHVCDRTFAWGDRTYIMGVLNVTPDSFSDGGDFFDPAIAVERGCEMVRQGADVLDIGGQSTRPGAVEVPLEEELQRTVPVIRALRQALPTPISIDTTKAAVLEAAADAGANFANDVSGGLADPQMLPAIAKLGMPAILMHMRGTPATMQSMTKYDDLLGTIDRYLRERMVAAQRAGIPKNKILLDPGIGFAKTCEQNLELLMGLERFREIGCPLLVGVSRKSFIGKILDRPEPKQRVWGTAAACTVAISRGADMLRVHDVAEMKDVCRVADTFYRGGDRCSSERGAGGGE